jgi:hypothetical protein
MKCDYCKKRLRHPKIVHTAAGAFHGECLDKLHATANALGPVIFAFMGIQKPGGPERVADALVQGAGPISEFLKDMARDARAR